MGDRQIEKTKGFGIKKSNFKLQQHGTKTYTKDKNNQRIP
jgi:hypothetical protein